MSDDEWLYDALPLEASTADKAFAATWPDGEPTPYTALGGAWLWWLALSDPAHYLNALQRLSRDPARWGDYVEAAVDIGNLGIMTFPVISEARPDDLAYIKFIDSAGGVAQGFADAELQDVWVLTVVRDPSDGWWRVHDLSRNYFPPADEVFSA